MKPLRPLKGLLNLVLNNGELEKESKLRSLKNRNNFLKVVLASICALSLLVIYINRITYYFTYLDAFDGEPDIYNLTKNKVKWHVYYGQQMDCDGFDCHLIKENFEQYYQKEMVLPAREFPLLNYKKGDLIYLRTRIKIPKDIIDITETQSIYSFKVWAKNWEVFFNGELFDEGGEEVFLTTIPTKFLKNDYLDIALKMNSDGLPYQGIANRRDMYLGPKVKLLKGYNMLFEEKSLRYLIFILPVIIICILFAILYVSIYKFNEVFYFILYGTLVSATWFVKTTYYRSAFDGVFSYFCAYVVLLVLAQYAFLLFIHNYFRSEKPLFKDTLKLIGSLVTAFLLLFSFHKPFQLLVLRSDHWMTAEFTIRLIAYVYGIYLSIKVTGFLKSKKANQVRRYSVMAMGIFLVVFLVINFMPILIPSGKNDFNNWSLTTDIFQMCMFVFLSILVGFEFTHGFLQRNVIKSAFGRYVDNNLVDELLERNNKIPFEKRMVTSLFLDIRSFTTISEIMSPDEIRKLLEEWRAEMIAQVKINDGYIREFAGDGMIAIWGAIDPRLDHALLAVKTAMGIRKSLVAFNKRRRASGLFEIRIGMGITSGEVIAGEIGTNDKSEFTIIGESLNLAARLEQLCKKFKADLIIDHEAFKQTQSQVVVSPQRNIEIRGLKRKITCYLLLGLLNDDGVMEIHDSHYENLISTHQGEMFIENAVGNVEFIDYNDAVSFGA